MKGEIQFSGSTSDWATDYADLYLYFENENDGLYYPAATVYIRADADTELPAPPEWYMTLRSSNELEDYIGSVNPTSIRLLSATESDYSGSYELHINEVDAIVVDVR